MTLVALYFYDMYIHHTPVYVSTYLSVSSHIGIPYLQSLHACILMTCTCIIHHTPVYIPACIIPCILYSQALYFYNVSNNLTPDDIQVLMETEDEVCAHMYRVLRCDMFVHVHSYRWEPVQEYDTNCKKSTYRTKVELSLSAIWFCAIDCNYSRLDVLWYFSTYK